MPKIIHRQTRFPTPQEDFTITAELLRDHAHKLDTCLRADVTWALIGTHDEYEAQFRADVPKSADDEYIRHLLARTMEDVKIESGDEMPDDPNIV